MLPSELHDREAICSIAGELQGASLDSRRRNEGRRTDTRSSKYHKVGLKDSVQIRSRLASPLHIQRLKGAPRPQWQQRPVVRAVGDAIFCILLYSPWRCGNCEGTEASCATWRLYLPASMSASPQPSHAEKLKSPSLQTCDSDNNKPSTFKSQVG